MLSTLFWIVKSELYILCLWLYSEKVFSFFFLCRFYALWIVTFPLRLVLYVWTEPYCSHIFSYFALRPDHLLESSLLFPLGL